MQSSIIIYLRTELLAKATSAPKLFRDLDKIEQFIAESCKTLSFIELIQKTDGTNSSNIRSIYEFNDRVILL